MAGNRDIEVILLRKRLHQERLLFGCIIFSLGLFIWLNHTRDTVFEVRLGSQPLAWLATDREALAVIRRARRELQDRHGSTGRFREEARGAFSIERMQGTQRQPMTEAEAVGAIASALTPEVQVAQIVIEGQPVLTLKTREMADTVMAAVRSALLGGEEGLVGEPTWKEQVVVREAYARPDSIEASAQSAIDRLLRGGEAGSSSQRSTSYRVQSGDRAWGIARNLGITVDELQRMNPEADFSRLLVGQVLKIARPVGRRPLLTLVARRRRAFVEDIPAPTREVPTTTLPRGERKVQSPGRAGKRRVTAEVREENGVPVEQKRTVGVSLLEPVSSVVLVGQAARAASSPRARDLPRRPASPARLPPPAPSSR